MNLKKKITGSLGLGLLLGAISPIVAQDAVVDTDTTEATVTFENGALDLVDAPTAITFGTVDLSADEETYLGASVATADDNGLLEVADSRGNQEGWHIIASMTGFTLDGEPSLPGSTLTFDTPDFDTTSTIADTAPVLSGMTISTDATAIPINALAGTGMGRSFYDWTTEGDVELFVPAGAGEVGTHTATITWSLDDTPS